MAPVLFVSIGGFLKYPFDLPLTAKAIFKDAIPISSNLTLTLENICKLALEVGFDACGTAPVRSLKEDAQYMDEWIAQGLHGNMSYLERNCDKRYDPAMLVPGAQTVVVCLLSFAHSGRDYHRRVKSLLYSLEAKLKEHFGEEIVSATHQRRGFLTTGFANQQTAD